jgi:hypothetical protein
MVSRKYETWEEFFDDVDVMCSNAMEYNEDGSEVYQDAQHIKVSTTMEMLCMWRSLAGCSSSPR